MTSLDAPIGVEELYDSRGEEVEVARPIFQGDVFPEVTFHGISDEPQMAMIISHPCSMRVGERLADLVTVARVEQRDSPVPLDKWSSSFFRFMPLPRLLPDEQDVPFRYLNLNVLATIRSEILDRHRRIACLSEYGIQLLQQRHIFNATRVVVELQTIYRELAPLFAELELGFDWTSAALSGVEQDVALAEQAEADFQQFMGPGNSERRANLRDETKRSLVRTEVRREIQTRFG